jgi:AraC-like DNA-binding protein
MRLDDELRRRLALARELLEAEDLPAPIALVARRAGISTYHFIRMFEATFGVTPHRYRTDIRLMRARRLLAQGAPVTQVCLQVGFSSLGSFSALFARRVGEAPSHYQRRIRTSVQVPADLTRLLAPGCLCLMGALPADSFRNFREA